MYVVAELQVLPHALKHKISNVGLLIGFLLGYGTDLIVTYFGMCNSVQNN